MHCRCGCRPERSFEDSAVPIEAVRHYMIRSHIATSWDLAINSCRKKPSAAKPGTICRYVGQLVFSER